MKKTFFCAALALAAVGGIVANKVTNQPSEPLSDLTMANIQALSDGESITTVGCTAEINSLCVIVSGSKVVKEYVNMRP